MSQRSNFISIFGDRGAFFPNPCWSKLRSSLILASESLVASLGLVRRTEANRCLSLGWRATEGWPSVQRVPRITKQTIKGFSIWTHCVMLVSYKKSSINICVLLFSFQVEFRLNLIFQTSLHSDKKAFQCDFCSKEFARKYSLTIHRRIHTGVKDYKCDVCSMAFRASNYLLQHKRIHTGLIEVKTQSKYNNCVLRVIKIDLEL